MQKVAASDQFARIATGPRGSDRGPSRLYESVDDKAFAVCRLRIRTKCVLE